MDLCRTNVLLWQGLLASQWEVLMIDKILGVGASLDWISPLASVLGDVVNGPSHTFLIPYDSCPLSGREVEILLRRQGVKSWGHMVVSGTLMVSVRLSQARWAEHLLEDAGVPIENPAATSGRAGRANRRRVGAGRRPSQRSELGSIADSVKEILDTRLF